MARPVTRKLELFALHAHEAASETYSGIFRRLETVPRNKRVFDVAGVVIGFPIVRYIGAKSIFIQATEGDPDAAALIFNRATGRTRETRLNESEVFSQVTHLVVVPQSRRAAIEYVRRGVKAVMLGPAIEGIMRAQHPDMRNFRLEFSPVPSKSFTDEIAEFERIRAASLRVTRPNASWTDHYTDLSEFMEESNGDKAEVDIRAGRGGDLHRNSGIVKAIKEVATDEEPYLDEATITGTRTGEERETTIRASKHIEHTRVAVNADDAGVPQPQSIRRALTNFLREWI